jgi:hypothetical protein
LIKEQNTIAALSSPATPDVLTDLWKGRPAGDKPADPSGSRS